MDGWTSSSQRSSREVTRLVGLMLEAGFAVMLRDDEGVFLRHSLDQREIVEHIMDVEECYVQAHEQNGGLAGHVFVVDGEINDFTENLEQLATLAMEN